MTSYPFSVPVTVIARVKSGIDGYGDDTYTETETVVDGVFAPGSSTELTQGGGDVVTTKPTVYLPDGLNLTAVDAVLVNGLRFQIDGDPQVWPAHPMTGWRPSMPVVVPLRKVTG